MRGRTGGWVVAVGEGLFFGQRICSFLYDVYGVDVCNEQPVLLLEEGFWLV